jgi:hypothetical protein
MRSPSNKLPHVSTGASRLRRLASRIGSTLGILWASPLTLVGVVLALPILLGRGKIHVVRTSTPALMVSGPVADYMLDRHPFGAMCAMAIGHVVIAEARGLTPQVLTHELEHVKQAACWGVLFPVVYLGASAWAALHGQDAYWNNVFEVAARRAENHA